MDARPARARPLWMRKEKVELNLKRVCRPHALEEKSFGRQLRRPIFFDNVAAICYNGLEIF